MLMQRILTAVPLALLLLWVILYRDSEEFSWLLYLIATLAGWEWAKLSGMIPSALRALYALTVLMVAVVLVVDVLAINLILLWVAIVWWLYMTIRMFTYTPTPMQLPSWGKMALGVLIIPLAVVAMHEVHSTHSAQWLLYGLLLVWVADIGAYFAGKRFGKQKLAPAVSPGKTREGLYGAMLMTTLYSAIAGQWFGLSLTAAALLVVLSIALTVVSVIGDLYESILKREFGVKDSGAILPGHGGILDRIDSVLATMPAFAVALPYLLDVSGTL